MAETTNYPVRIRMKPELLAELRECELGSFEDFEALRDSVDPADQAEAKDMIFGFTHRHEILGRHKGVIELRDANEVAEVYYGAASGTFQIRENSAQCYRAAVRLCNQLRPILETYSTDSDIALLLRQWPRPAGY